ncbi:hypothetical protein cypCar_00004524, partial [Cyprinus carpio]
FLTTVKISKKNELHERGRWLQMCRFKTSAPKNCDYESMRQAYNIRVPQRFHFAKDMHEQWETKEKSSSLSVVFDSFTFRALEHCLFAGASIYPEVMWKWKELTGLDVCEGYGQTETVYKHLKE